jgi:hypothetical protein
MKVDLNYDDVWSAMNALEELSTKMLSIRAVIDSASEYASNDDTKQSERLCSAAVDLIDWYIQTWDELFPKAWDVTVAAIKHAEFDEARKNSPFFFGTSTDTLEVSQYTEEELNAMCDTAYKGNLDLFEYSNK